MRVGQDGSSAGPQAAALSHTIYRERGTGRGPPLDAACLTVRSGLLVGVFFTPTGCLAASVCFSRIPDMLIAGIR